MMNKKDKIADAAILTILLSSLTIIVGFGASSYGQEQQQQQIIAVTPPNDTRVLEQSEIKNRVSIGLIRGELTDYKLYADGRGEFIFQIGTSNRTMNITINQPWGAAEGYIYNSTGVYTPDGSQRLIIATN
jgi:hypothetical protein